MFVMDLFRKPRPPPPPPPKVAQANPTAGHKTPMTCTLASPAYMERCSQRNVVFFTHTLHKSR
jgi:hypothetical protein